MNSFVESLKAAGIVASEWDRTTGWPKFMNLDRLVVLQYPEDESEQIGLHRTLKSACRRKEITSTPALAWAGLYLSSPDVRVPFDKLLETTDFAVDALAFSEWLKRSDTKPSIHVAAWFAKFGILDRTTTPAQTAMPAPVVADGDAPAKRSNRKPSWETVAMPYMKSLFTAGHYKSASMFYKALMHHAGESDSPFKLVNRELYCTEAGTTVSDGSLGNVWPQIRAH